MKKEVDFLRDKVAELQDEITVLRAALTEVSSIGDDGYPVSDCRNIARAALEERHE